LEVVLLKRKLFSLRERAKLATQVHPQKRTYIYGTSLKENNFSSRERAKLATQVQGLGLS
jgi:hypothetical protein